MDRPNHFQRLWSASGELAWRLMPLLAAAALIYLPAFDTAVYADDWVRIRKFYFGQLPLLDLSSRRPLEEAVFGFFFGLFGLNFRVLLAVQILILLLCALLIAEVVRRAFPSAQVLALPAGLLFLTYPGDYTRLWFTRIYHWVILAAVLAGALLLLDYAARGGWPRLAAALALMTLSLGAYDGQLGLVLASGLLPALLLRGLPARRRLLLLLPAALGSAFAVWRLALQPALLGVRDPYLAGMSFDPLQLVLNTLRGYPVLLRVWIHPFEGLLPGISPLKLGAILAACAAGLPLAALAFLPPEPRPTLAARLGATRPLLLPLAVGLALTAAGFFPAIVQGGAMLDMNTASTRANQYAFFGAALALAALLAAGLTLLNGSPARLPVLLYVALSPLLLNGLVQQTWVQAEAHLAWSRQQFFYRNLFLAVPNLRDGATLLVVEKTPYPARPFERLPLMVEWEINNAVAVLYNNPSLQGMLYLPDFSRGGSRETRLEADGAHGYDIPLAVYERMVIVLYTPANGKVELVSDPEKELELEFAIQGYQPWQWILEQPPASAPARQLLH